ncbi:hypothetical protein HMPREF1028_01613 [Neisseria sp. GT4A_CT1]|nr:hypothetical protein HMPREF1028_01613 [Neisseria sp. GT4A_CT1]
MPAYFHFSNSPPRLTAIRTEYPLFTHLSLPSSNELNPYTSQDSHPPRFSYFSDDPNTV